MSLIEIIKKNRSKQSETRMVKQMKVSPWRIEMMRLNLLDGPFCINLKKVQKKTKKVKKYCTMINMAVASRRFLNLLSKKVTSHFSNSFYYIK